MTDMPEIHAPIDERIYALVNDMDVFNFKVVRNLFPHESDKTLYRALNKLETAGRIKFLFWNQKMKHFTCAGVSKFPIFTRGETNYDLAGLFRQISNQYGKDGRPAALKAFDDLYIDMCRLFLIVDSETDKEFKDQYILLHDRLMEYKRKLSVMQSDIDAVLMHATLRGDLEYFKTVFTNKDAPDAQEKLTFKRWFTDILNKRKANEG